MAVSSGVGTEERLLGLEGLRLGAKYKYGCCCNIVVMDEVEVSGKCGFR